MIKEIIKDAMHVDHPDLEKRILLLEAEIDELKRRVAQQAVQIGQLEIKIDHDKM